MVAITAQYPPMNQLCAQNAMPAMNPESKKIEQMLKVQRCRQMFMVQNNIKVSAASPKSF